MIQHQRATTNGGGRLRKIFHHVLKLDVEKYLERTAGEEVDFASIPPHEDLAFDIWNQMKKADKERAEAAEDKRVEAEGRRVLMESNEASMGLRNNVRGVSVPGIDQSEDASKAMAHLAPRPNPGRFHRNSDAMPWTLTRHSILLYNLKGLQLFLLSGHLRLPRAAHVANTTLQPSMNVIWPVVPPVDAPQQSTLQASLRRREGTEMLSRRLTNWLKSVPFR